MVAAAGGGGRRRVEGGGRCRGRAKALDPVGARDVRCRGRTEALYSRKEEEGGAGALAREEARRGGRWRRRRDAAGEEEGCSTRGGRGSSKRVREGLGFRAWVGGFCAVAKAHNYPPLPATSGVKLE